MPEPPDSEDQLAEDQEQARDRPGLDNRDIPDPNVSGKSRLEFVRDLECENNQISELDSFQFLGYLRTLKLKDNDIKNIFDLEKGLVCLKSLSVLDIRDNPVLSIPKYRDMIIMMGLNLRELNEKNVLKHEREFLFRLHKRKQQ